MIFEQLSLEFYLTGKPLPWTKPRATPNVMLFEGELDMIRVVDNHVPGRPRTPYDRPQYFNLRG